MKQAIRYANGQTVSVQRQEEMERLKKVEDAQKTVLALEEQYLLGWLTKQSPATMLKALISTGLAHDFFSAMSTGNRF